VIAGQWSFVIGKIPLGECSRIAYSILYVYRLQRCFAGRFAFGQFSDSLREMQRRGGSEIFGNLRHHHHPIDPVSVDRGLPHQKCVTFRSRPITEADWRIRTEANSNARRNPPTPSQVDVLSNSIAFLDETLLSTFSRHLSLTCNEFGVIAIRVLIPRRNLRQWRPFGTQFKTSTKPQ
jgi:hypothetical protein